MKKYFILFVVIFFAACINNPNRGSCYTEEQIKSLNLDHTVVLNTNRDSVENIDLNSFLKAQNFNLEPLIKNINLISLETTEESLLDVIYKIIVTDSNIYIYDRFKGGGLVVFDSEGRFIRRVPYGQGPGEINRLWDVSYDFEARRIVAYQHPFLLFYTSDGRFVEQKKLPFGFYNFHVTTHGYVFKTLDGFGNEHLRSLKDYTFLVTDKNFKLNAVALPFYCNDISYGGYNYLYRKKDALTVTERFKDTIYQYMEETNRIEAKYVLDFQKKKLPDKFLEGSMSRFEEAINNNDYYYFLGEYLETKRQNVFFLMNNYTGLKTIVYRDKYSKMMIGGTQPIYDRQQIPPIDFPVATYENSFISYYSALEADSLLSRSSFLSEEDKKILEISKEDDNPILIFFELNDF